MGFSTQQLQRIDCMETDDIWRHPLIEESQALLLVRSLKLIAFSWIIRGTGPE